jgi:type II secretory pathway predicted ATPase ExeA
MVKTVKDGEGSVGHVGTNPFTPSFGVDPPKLVGRGEELDSFTEALISGPGATGRSMLFTGPRGAGKTVLLNAVEQIAAEHGWIVVSDAAHKDLVDDLTNTVIPELLARYDSAATSSVTGFNASVLGIGAGVNRQKSEKYPVVPTFRYRLSQLVELAEKRNSGVLLSIDEVHKASIDDMREIAQAVQLGFRRSRQLAFVAAGLPSAVADILNDAVISFLRRSALFPIGEVAEPDAATAIAVPLQESGVEISDEALRFAADASKGFPFLVQLIGYQLWVSAFDAGTVGPVQAKHSVKRAIQEMARMVFEPAVHDLSDRDRDFLEAMAIDDGPSLLTDVAERMGVDRGYVNRYRRRLIAADIIQPAGRGKLDFAIPYIRDYLR